MPSMQEICLDLSAEQDVLEAMVERLSLEQWDSMTPAEGWTVRDQISHLHFFDDRARLAATDPEAFKAWRDEAMKTNSLQGKGETVDVVLGRSVDPEELLDRWRSGTEELNEALMDLDPKARVPWFGPDMSATSKATARLMETWAHGQDIADALGIHREPTHRLKHVCHIGVRAIPFAYSINKKEMPTEEIRFELQSPFNGVWTWGPETASNFVSGTAEDFALLVIQRRHRDDTDLVANGAVANEFLSIAQAFAGPPGGGRVAGQFQKVNAVV